MPETSAAATSAAATDGRRLIYLFGLVYFAQGIGQHSGLVAQPLNHYFKAALGLDPAQTTEYLAILTIPWTLKPLYGLLSDFVPLAGYRRKSWLLLANLLAALGGPAAAAAPWLAAAALGLWIGLRRLLAPSRGR